MNLATVSTVERGRLERLRAPGITIGGLAAATLALRLRDPHVEGSWGLCPSAAFGVYCPGCGGLRAVNDLTHGDVFAAASSNLVLVVAVPFIVAGLAVWTVDRWRGRPARWTLAQLRALTFGSLAVALVFTVVRNLDLATWLAP